jgi:predicted metal-dependent phosphoesterase TrpH
MRRAVGGTAAAGGVIAAPRAVGLVGSLLGVAPVGAVAPLAAMRPGLVQLPHGAVVRDPYAGASKIPWWKGQLHTHTARSFDGDPSVPPSRRAAQYQAANYDFTVLTDHDRVSSLADEGVPRAGTSTGGEGPFLTIPGVESTDWTAHLGVWLLGEEARLASLDPPIVAADRPAVERMEAWAAAGALVCCNHPNHSSAPLSPEQVEAWAGGGVPFRFVEVFNTRAITSADALAHNAEVWRRAVSAAGPDRPVWGVASDDSHGHVVGQAWIAVAAPALAPAALREALLAGRFYGSSGLAFNELGTNPEMGGIEAAAPGASTIRFVGDDGSVVHQIEGSRAVYVPDGKARWVRVEASDLTGRMAWSQPFWLDA